MSEAEVEGVFKAKPLESGKVETGFFKVYGSNESFNIDPALLYSNVLVLYKDGKASVIYAIDGGSDWRKNFVMSLLISVVVVNRRVTGVVRLKNFIRWELLNWVVRGTCREVAVRMPARAARHRSCREPRSFRRVLV